MTTNCERFQAQLLDHLYDLLDDGDKHALEAHLTGCASCQEALRHAEDQRALIGAAAKQEFKTVRFEAPEEPRIVPLMPRTTSRAGHAWTPWAMAAAILLLISFGVVSGVSYMNGRIDHTQQLA